MKHRFGLLLVLWAVLVPAGLHSETYDLIIRNGRVVDGTGNPAFFADVAVKDGRIAAIGRIAGKAKTEIDAKGLIVAPGFIDVHTHADEIAEMPKAENFVRMGVTTMVAGNCGGSRWMCASSSGGGASQCGGECGDARRPQYGPRKGHGRRF